MQKDIRFFDGFNLLPGTGDLKAALAQLIQLTAEAGNSHAASIFIVDSRENVLKPLITFGLPESYVKACGDIRIGDQCCGRAVQQRKTWIVSDMLTDPLFASARGAALDSPIRAAFSVPIIDQTGRCIGSLACHYSEPYTPTSEDIDRNDIWATMIAHTIFQYQHTPLPTAESVLFPKPSVSEI
jgi:GAF domain-containing protein